MKFYAGLGAVALLGAALALLQVVLPVAEAAEVTSAAILLSKCQTDLEAQETDFMRTNSARVPATCEAVGVFDPNKHPAPAAAPPH